MKRPYYIPPILTAALIALGMLASATGGPQGTGARDAPAACAMPVEADRANCTR